MPGGLGGEHGNPDPNSAYQGSYVLGSDLTGLNTNPGDYEASLGDRAYTASSPVIDCSSYTNVHLTFQQWLNVEGPTYDHAYIDVYDGSSWTQVWTNSSGISENSWSAQDIDISAIADNNANVRIRFSIGATDGSWFYSGWNIDDLALTGNSSSPCTTPTNQPTALNLTPDYTTIDGSFTAATSSPDGYLVVVSTDPTLDPADLPVDGDTYVAGNTIGDGTVVQSGAGTSFTATGLAPGTQYYFFIFSQNFNCSGGPLYLTTSPLTGNANTLDCTVSAFPYTENFDAVTIPDLPACWTIEDNSAPDDDWVSSTTNPNSSPNCLRISYDFSDPLDDWAFTPPLELSAGVTYKVEFQYRAGSTSYDENLEVDWGSSASSAGMSGTPIFDDNGFTHTTYTEGSGTFTPSSDGTYYVGWHAYSDANKLSINVDDIVISEELPCSTPADQPTALNLTPSYTSIDGSFTAAASAPDGYLVVMSTNSSLSSDPVDGTTYNPGDPLGGGTVVQSNAAASFTATGLTPGTQYYFFVFSQNFNCTGGPLYLTTSPLTGNTTTLTATPVPYTHNFDTQDNWNTSGTASIWERGDQTNDSFAPPSGHSANSVYGTVLNDDYDVASIEAYLETPFFDLAGSIAPRLTFWMDMESESGFDGGVLQISVNGGAWTTIDQADYTLNPPNDATVTGLGSGLGWTGTQPTGEWQKVKLDLFNLTNTGLAITNTDDIQLRFWFGSDGSIQNYPGWYIDDFSIYEPNDQTSQVDAPGTQISAGTISSLANDNSAAVSVFKFDVTDLGSGDGVSTYVTNFVIENEGSGTADWTDHIAGAQLWNNGAAISDLNVNITDTEITFYKTSGSFEVADGTSEEVTLKIWLNHSNIVDNSTMVFQIPDAAHGFVALESGSEFADPFPGPVISNIMTVNVVASELVFSGQPSSTATSGVALTTQPIVSATDANGNTDLDISSLVTLSNTGGLTMANNSMNFVSGVADFNTPANFMFTSGGKYVFLEASAPGLQSVSPSSEIAVDIIGCTIFEEDFEAYANTSDLPTPDGLWDYIEITNSSNDWGIGNNGSNQILTIYNNNTQQEYNFSNDGEIIAYYTNPIDAREFKNLTIDFNWQSDGEFTDYGTLVWSTDGVNWSVVEETNYEGQPTPTLETNVDIAVCDGLEFYIGFRWINDGSSGTNPPFAVDNIVLRGFPKFDYNFSYRNDTYEPITGTVVSLDAQNGANIFLPSGFDFEYDGTTITKVRANLNGWLEMGTTHTGDAAPANELSNTSYTPFLAPFWDDLSSDVQTRIIYKVEGTAPARVFTIEWKDVLWGSERLNFQVKLYETSDVIEFWYGTMNSYNSGNASIGINNTGTCMNKLISINPEEIPIASYTADINHIRSAQYLTEGMVYIFNPLQMQEYRSWQEATIVVGQPDFTTINTTASQTIAAGAYSSNVSSKGVLASSSGSANRVMIWNDIQTSNGAPADVVVGQPDFTSTAAGLSATELDNPHNVCFTPDGNKLLIVDASNNRVLIYNDVPDDMSGAPYAADVVIGQTDFVSSLSGTGADKLNYPTGAIVLPDGKLLISDFGNNRVLVFNKVPSTNGVAADYVIGQPDLTTTTAGTSADKLGSPWDCAYTPEGKLLISDDNSHRIMIYNNMPTTSGVSADKVIGNDVFGAKVAGSDRDEFDQPSVTCSVEGKLAIADFGNSRVMMYDRIPKTNGAPADYVLGQPNFTDNVEFNDGYNNIGSADARNMYYPYSICFDLNGRLYVNGTRPDGLTGMHRIMVFGESPTETADLEIAISSDETEVCVFSDVEYTVEITNNGPDDAYSVVVNAQLPIGFIANGYNASIGTYNQKSGYWSIPYIANGQTVTLTFEGEVQPNLSGTSVTAYSNIIASEQADDDFSNNGTSQVVIVRVFSAPTFNEIDDQYINRNEHTIPVIDITVDDEDGLSDISTYTCTSSNTTLIPIDYTNNLLFGGTAPDKTLDIYPATDEYGYSTMEVIITDTHGCYKKKEFEVTVGNIWRGVGSSFFPNKETDWQTTENWTSSSVPDNAMEAIIPTTPEGGFFPIIDEAGNECEDLVIEPKASVTINDTYELDINGNLTIQSDITGTGSIVDYNSAGFNQITVSGDIIIERYVAPDAWHYLASPLTGVTNKVLTENVCGLYNGNVLDYNEAFNSDYDGDGDIDWFDGWEWPWFYSQNDDPLVPANGYAYYTFAGNCSDKVEFTGTSVDLNTGNYSYLVTNQDDTYYPTGVSPHRGWNLVGNPYPSGLNADEFIAANSSVIDGTIYFWDELGFTGFNLEGSDYASYNPTLGATTGSGSGSVLPDEYISNGQAFFVHRTVTDVAGTNIVFSNDMRESENSYFFKKQKQVKEEVAKIKLSIKNSQDMYNEIIVGFVDDATDGFDHLYDGRKIEGNPDLSFYTIIDDAIFTIQAIAPLSKNVRSKQIILGFNAGFSGDYEINLEAFEFMPDNIQVYLEDTYNDKFINLRTNYNYSFSVQDTGRYDNRFILHFNFNHPPELVYEIADYNVLEDEQLYYDIPAYYFNDPDYGDILNYELKMANNNQLPLWLDFDEQNLIITGAPNNSDVGKYRMKLVATDLLGANAEAYFTIYVQNVNDPPVLANPIEDIEITALNPLIFTIPENTFYDIDPNDQLRYQASLTTNNSLPAWLIFDPQTATFSGTPNNNDAGIYNIRVFAFDKANTFAFDDFELNVQKTSDLNNLNSDFLVYPNPSDGEFVIESKIAVYSFIITDATGKAVYVGQSSSTRKQIDITNLTEGIYNIQILYDNLKIVTKRITIKK